ncbi:3-hydroxyacyl-CoA dehydrogenase family protein [Haloplanus aerogenes]|uniref:3-hydroxyacyl-CoA dehydrogenase family protein n=1 Tax=Haloplanus aerogenes TaxID=660522 RepID=A0A3M0E5Z7_9EURY|nr:3-hydroxyacyl-CoA dehydrogenase NAD-binding domain-containing protein [Haloplanus aerogenes]AZH24719.1 3-hydroxyacyl-CoA dehydrogenase family protein [Haloplanus aerogenes]RMB23623.1 3-hydroxybutyryl-CoA dehydrogenase [Haloplanus aerogenes]
MSSTTPSTPSAVAVVGAGTMGHGLALQFARHGAGVTLVDHRESNLDDARRGIDDALDFLDSEGWLDADPDAVRTRIDYTLDTAAAVADVDLVIETVSEDLAVKEDVFGTLAAAAPDDAVLATNTSGIPITDIAATVPEAADRVVGCHWWNPPYLLPTVEVVRGTETSDETVDRTAAFVEAVDRQPIRVERDVPGFVWNRIQFAVLRECTHLVAEGVASLEDVERAVRDGYALRTAVVGPFETADLAGLELFRDIAANLYPHLSDADEPGPVFEERLDAGRGGVDDGAGFHEYDESPSDVIRRRNERVVAIMRALD